MNHVVEPRSATVVLNGQEIEIHVYQFVGLVWLLQFNCEMTGDVGDPARQDHAAKNALLNCFAALEALVLETAIIAQRALYADRQWRHSGLVAKFRSYLDAAGRGKEEVPRFVAEISDLRRALTHSEPDNPRFIALNESIRKLEGKHYVRRLQEVARFLWQGDGPPHFEGAFKG